jgi:low temperature requirement protein LtrA
LWLSAIVIGLVAAGLSTRQSNWALNAGHFTKRHALFAIVALCESVVVVGLTTAAEPRTATLLFIALCVVLLTYLFWWCHFGWSQKAALSVVAKSKDSERSRMASIA